MPDKIDHVTQQKDFSMKTTGTIILASLIGAAVSSCEQANLEEAKNIVNTWVQEVRQFVEEKTDENMETIADGLEQVQGQLEQQVDNLSSKNEALISQLSGVFASDKTVVMLSKVENFKEELAEDIMQVRSSLNRQELSNKHKELLAEITETYEEINLAITDVKKASNSQLKTAKLNLQNALEETVRKLDDLELRKVQK